jgi:hypothetical protein
MQKKIAHPAFGIMGFQQRSSRRMVNQMLVRLCGREKSRIKR